MDYSDVLRKKIEKKIGVNLSKYLVTYEIFDRFSKVLVDNLYEPELRGFTIADVYELGLNIGGCNVTSRYFVREFKESELVYGTCKLLIGTKNSRAGSHSFCKINYKENIYYFDPTLKLLFPFDDIDISKYYDIKTQVHHEGGRILSEYDLFTHSYNERIKDISKYEKSILKS